MFVPLLRSALLFSCTAATFLVLGRAPGAVTLRTREIEASISADGRAGRDRTVEQGWASGRKPA